MPLRTIRYRIRPDGRVEELVEGVTGEGCQALTERIEARLGGVTQRRSTSDAFVSQPQDLRQTVSLQRPQAA